MDLLKEGTVLTPSKMSLNGFMEESVFDTPVPQATSTVDRPRLQSFESQVGLDDSEDTTKTNKFQYQQKSNETQLESFTRKLNDLQSDATLNNPCQSISDAGSCLSSLGILQINSSSEFPDEHLSDSEVSLTQLMPRSGVKSELCNGGEVGNVPNKAWTSPDVNVNFTDKNSTEEEKEQSYVIADLRHRMQLELARRVIQRATDMEKSASNTLNQRDRFSGTGTGGASEPPSSIEAISTNFSFMTNNSALSKNPFTTSSTFYDDDQFSKEEFIPGELAADKLLADEESCFKQRTEIPLLTLQDVNADFSQVANVTHMNVSVGSTFLGSEHHGEHKQMPIEEFFRLKGDKIEDIFQKDGSRISFDVNSVSRNQESNILQTPRECRHQQLSKDNENNDSDLKVTDEIPSRLNEKQTPQNAKESLHSSPSVMSMTKIADILSNAENLSPQSMVDQFLKHAMQKKPRSPTNSSIDDHLTSRILKDHSNTPSQDSSTKMGINSKIIGLESYLSNMSLFDYRDNMTTNSHKLGKHKPLEEDASNCGSQIKHVGQQTVENLTSSDVDSFVKRLKMSDGRPYKDDDSDLLMNLPSPTLARSIPSTISHDSSLSLLPASDVEMTSDASDGWILMADSLVTNQRRSLKNLTAMQPDLLNMISLVTPSGDKDIMNFGLLPESCCQKMLLTIVNRQKRDIPLKVTVKNASELNVFAISDFSVRNTSAGGPRSDDQQVVFSLKSSDKDARISVSFSTPTLEEMGQPSGFVEFSAVLSVELDNPAQQQTQQQMHGMLLRGRVGLTRLSFGRPVTPWLNLTCGVGEVVTHPFPMKNLGLVPLNLQLDLTPVAVGNGPTLMDEAFTVEPRALQIMPGCEGSANVCFAPRPASNAVIEMRFVARVKPNGSSYESGVRGIVRTKGGRFGHWPTTSAPKESMDPSKRTLVEHIETTHRELVWASVRVGKMDSRTCTIRNSSQDVGCKVDLQVTINDPTNSYKVLNEFGGRMGQRILVLHATDVYRLTISLLPTQIGAIAGKIEFGLHTPSPQPANELKQSVRLYAYGGYAKVCIQDIPKDGAGRLWLSLGELSSVRSPLVAQFKLHNTGNLPGFAHMKFVLKGLGTMLNSSLKVEPSQVVIQPGENVEVRILYEQPHYGNIPSSALEVIEVATLRILHGDEPTRLRLRRVVNKMQSSGQFAKEPLALEMMQLCRPFAGERGIPDVSSLRDPESAGRMLYQSLVLQEVSLIVDKPQDISMLGKWSSFEDSTRLFKPLCEADSTSVTRCEATLDDALSLWSLWPFQLMLYPPSVVSGTVEIRNLSGQTNTFEAEVSDNSIIVVEPMQGIIAPFKTFTLTVYCKSLPIINQCSEYILKVYLENEMQHVLVIVEQGGYSKPRRSVSTRQAVSPAPQATPARQSIVDPLPCKTSTPIAGVADRPRLKYYAKGSEKIISGSAKGLVKRPANVGGPKWGGSSSYALPQRPVVDVAKRSHSVPLSNADDGKKRPRKKSSQSARPEPPVPTLTLAPASSDTASPHFPDNWVDIYPTGSPSASSNTKLTRAALDAAKMAHIRNYFCLSPTKNDSAKTADKPPLEDMLHALSIENRSSESSSSNSRETVFGTGQSRNHSSKTFMSRKPSPLIPATTSAVCGRAPGSNESKPVSLENMESPSSGMQGRLFSDNYDVCFPPTVVGSTTSFKITVKNSSSQMFQLEVSSLTPPFSVNATSFELKGKWYISFKVYFRPLSVGFYKQCLTVKPVGGPSLKYLCSGNGIACIL